MNNSNLIDTLNGITSAIAPICTIAFIIALSFILKMKRGLKNALPKEENENALEKFNNTETRDYLVVISTIIIIVAIVLLTKSLWLLVPLELIVLILAENNNIKLRRQLKNNNVFVEENIEVEKAHEEIKKTSTGIGVIIALIVALSPIWIVLLFIWIFMNMPG